MKTKLLSLILLATVAMISFPSEADALPKLKVKKYNESITGNPLALMFGMFDITYEKAISSKNSFTAGMTYFGYSGWAGYNFSGSYRWYYPIDKRRIIEGLSFGPTVGLTYWTYNGVISDAYDGGGSIYVGGEVAYKLIIEKWFTIEPIIKVYLPVFGVDGLTMRNYGLGVNLGYSW